MMCSGVFCLIMLFFGVILNGNFLLCMQLSSVDMQLSMIYGQCVNMNVSFFYDNSLVFSGWYDCVECVVYVMMYRISVVSGSVQVRYVRQLMCVYMWLVSNVMIGIMMLLVIVSVYSGYYSWQNRNCVFSFSGRFMKQWCVQCSMMIIMFLDYWNFCVVRLLNVCGFLLFVIVFSVCMLCQFFVLKIIVVE